LRAGTLYHVCAAGTAALLVASPLRNLHHLDTCFGDPAGVMDVPALEMELETRLLALQVSGAILGIVALALSAPRRRVFGVAAAGAWGLVALGGLLWDKWLDNFSSGDLGPRSIYACLLEARSEHTHSLWSNTPLMFSVVLALWVLWRSVRTERFEKN
jgi:hypothetical protein